MSERHLEVVEAEFGFGPDCPTCHGKITPQVAMDEHAPLCAELSQARAALELCEKYLVDRGIEFRGTVGRTVVLPAIRAVLAGGGKK